MLDIATRSASRFTLHESASRRISASVLLRHRKEEIKGTVSIELCRDRLHGFVHACIHIRWDEMVCSDLTRHKTDLHSFDGAVDSQAYSRNASMR